MEDKKSFVLYADLIHTVDKMSDGKAGVLFKTILGYVNDRNPVVTDMLVDLVFEPIKRQMKRDLQKYIGTKIERSMSGRIGNLKRWNKDLYDDVFAKKMSIDEAEKIAENRKTSHSDTQRSLPIANIAVNDTVTVTDTVILLEKETKGKIKFSDPSLAEVKSEIETKNLKTVNAESFFNFYESKNWFVGKNKMKNWKMALAGWESRNLEKNPKNNNGTINSKSIAANASDGSRP